MIRVHSESFSVSTRGKGTYEITGKVESAVRASGVVAGTVTVFVRHTSCSLIIMENADPTARRDLENFFERFVPEDTPYFEHTAEGADDSTSHIRSVLTRSSEVVRLEVDECSSAPGRGFFSLNIGARLIVGRSYFPSLATPSTQVPIIVRLGPLRTLPASQNRQDVLRDRWAIPSIDQIMVEERAAAFTKRSIKTSAKLAGLSSRSR